MFWGNDGLHPRRLANGKAGIAALGAAGMTPEAGMAPDEAEVGQLLGYCRCGAQGGSAGSVSPREKSRG